MSKIYHPNDHEDLLVFNPDDEPLKPEQIEDLEGPLNKEAKLVLPDLIKVKDELLQHDLELRGEREICSSGVFGPLFKLRAFDPKTGQEIYLLERTFTDVQDLERRFSLAAVSNTPWRTDSEPRYEIINPLDHHQDKLIIDYLYNEAKALEDLQGVKGVPKFYGAVYDDLRGSILEEFITGSDLSEILMAGKEQIKKNWPLADIFEQIKKTYTQAAEMGFIHNNPAGGTIMIGADKQAYLADWYLYSQGLINNEGPIKEKYLQGLKDLEDLEKNFLDCF